MARRQRWGFGVGFRFWFGFGVEIFVFYIMRVNVIDREVLGVVLLGW